MAKDRSAVGRKSKAKGNTFERWIAKRLTIVTGHKFHRTPSSGGSGLSVGFRLAGDVVTDDKSWPFCVEAKAREGWHFGQLFSPTCVVWKWWKQAVKEASTVQMAPLLVFKKRNSGVFVMLDEQWAADIPKWIDDMPAMTIHTGEHNTVTIVEFKTFETLINKGFLLSTIVRPSRMAGPRDRHETNAKTRGVA